MTLARPQQKQPPQQQRLEYQSPRSPRFAWLRGLVSEYMVLFITLAYFLGVWPFLPEFGAADLQNVFSNMLPLLAVAVGQTIVLIGGGIDLSMTAVIALSSVTGAYLMTMPPESGGPAPVAVAVGAMVLIGMVVGLLNGLFITLLSMPPFIVTLTMTMLVSGVAVWLTQSRNIGNLPAGFTAISHGAIGIVPYALLVVGGLLLVMHFMLERTVYGQWLFAVGSNGKAALISGVPVRRVVVLSYVLCGACAAVSGILFTARLRTGSPVHGERILLDVIGAVVIGGTSLFGGRGKILWTVLGVLFLTLLTITLNILGLSYAVIMMVKGAVILAAAALDLLRNRVLPGR
jgi:ribose transport system permease protein